MCCVFLDIWRVLLRRVQLFLTVIVCMAVLLSPVLSMYVVNGDPVFVEFRPYQTPRIVHFFV